MVEKKKIEVKKKLADIRKIFKKIFKKYSKNIQKIFERYSKKYSIHSRRSGEPWAAWLRTEQMLSKRVHLRTRWALLHASTMLIREIFKKYSKNIQKIFKKYSTLCRLEASEEQIRSCASTGRRSSCNCALDEPCSRPNERAVGEYSKNIQKIFKNIQKIFKNIQNSRSCCMLANSPCTDRCATERAAFACAHRVHASSRGK